MRPIGPGAPMRMLGVAALDLGARRVAEIGAVALARVDDQHAAPARRRQQRAAGPDGGAQQRDVVAQRLAEAARLEEVALHVDDDDRGAIRLDRDRLRLGVDDQRLHVSPPFKEDLTPAIISDAFRES